MICLKTSSTMPYDFSATIVADIELHQFIIVKTMKLDFVVEGSRNHNL